MYLARWCVVFTLITSLTYYLIAICVKYNVFTLRQNEQDNLTWQPISSRDEYAFSAFFDGRVKPPVIRIIGIALQENVAKGANVFRCHFSYQRDGAVHVGKPQYAVGKAVPGKPNLRYFNGIINARYLLSIYH